MVFHIFSFCHSLNLRLDKSVAESTEMRKKEHEDIAFLKSLPCFQTGKRNDKPIRKRISNASGTCSPALLSETTKWDNPPIEVGMLWGDGIQYI